MLTLQGHFTQSEKYSSRQCGGAKSTQWSTKLKQNRNVFIY